MQAAHVRSPARCKQDSPRGLTSERGTEMPSSKAPAGSIPHPASHPGHRARPRRIPVIPRERRVQGSPIQRCLQAASPCSTVRSAASSPAAVVLQPAGEAPEPCLSPWGGAEGLHGPTLPAAAPPGPDARSSGRDKSSVSQMRQRSCETSRTICTVFSGNPLSFPYSCCSKKLLHDIPSRAAQAITELGKRRQNPEDALAAHSTRLMVYPPTDLHHSSSAAPEDE